MGGWGGENKPVFSMFKSVSDTERIAFFVVKADINKKEKK